MIPDLLRKEVDYNIADYIDLLVGQGFLNEDELKHIVEKYNPYQRDLEFIKITDNPDRHEYEVYFSAEVIDKYFPDCDYFNFGYDVKEGKIVFKPNKNLGFEFNIPKKGSLNKRHYSKEITNKIMEITGQEKGTTRKYNVEWDEEKGLLYLVY